MRPKRLSALLVVVIASCTLAACSTTVPWAEKVTLSSGASGSGVGGTSAGSTTNPDGTPVASGGDSSPASGDGVSTAADAGGATGTASVGGSTVGGGTSATTTSSSQADPAVGATGGTAKTTGVAGKSTTTSKSSSTTKKTTANASSKPGSGKTTTATTAGSSTASAAPILVGLVADDYTGIAKAFGVNIQISYFVPYENLFKYINAHGGMSGHQIKYVEYEVNGAAASASSEAQAACTSLAEDSKVQVVLSTDYVNSDFASCLNTHGIAQIDDTQYASTRGDLQNLPNFISPEGLTLNREAPIVMAAMHATGFLTSTSVVGVIVGGCDDETAAYNATMPALAKQYGFTLVEDQLECYTGDAALASATSQIQSAVLKFRSAMVDRVFALSVNEGYIFDQFTAAAKNQNYFPGYIATSEGNNSANSDQSNSNGYTAQALAMMHGVSWSPLTDLGAMAPTSPGSTAGQNICKTMDPSDTPTAGTTYYVQLASIQADCDDVRLLQGMIAASGGSTSVQSLRDAYATLGSSFQAAEPYLGGLSTANGIQEGIVSVQNFSYKGNCSCFTADGSAYTAAS